MGCFMVIVPPGMNKIYELLAFIVALYFPAALVAWMVIDKIFVSGDGKTHSVRGRSKGNGPSSILADHGRRER